MTGSLTFAGFIHCTWQCLIAQIQVFTLFLICDRVKYVADLPDKIKAGDSRNFWNAKNLS